MISTEAAARFIREYFTNNMISNEIFCIEVARTNSFDIIFYFRISGKVYKYSLPSISFCDCLFNEKYMRRVSEKIYDYFKDLEVIK